MYNYTNNQIEKGNSLSASLKNVYLICILLLIASGPLFSQENIWETTKPKGENPWVTEETKETTPTPKVSSNGLTTTQAPSNDTVYLNNKPNLAALNSTQTIRQFNINGEVVEFNKNSYNYFKMLKKEGKTVHNASAAMGAGVVTGSVISFIALPINMIAAAVPTNKTNELMNKFEVENPHATAAEKKAFNNGIKEKRFGQAFTGNLIGIAINAIAILVIGSL